MFNIRTIPEYLYHVTPKSNLKSIKKEGLKPSESQSSLSAIFLALYEDIAEEYSYAFNEECVLLKISTHGLNEDSFWPDNYELKYYIETEETGFYSWDECSYIDSLNICGQCAYNNVIRTELIEFP